MKNEQEIKKPLALELEEAEKETVAAVNSIMLKHNLPCYFYEIIFDKIHRQLKDGARGEIDTAAMEYKAAVAARAKADAVPPEKEVK